MMSNANMAAMLSICEYASSDDDDDATKNEEPEENFTKLPHTTQSVVAIQKKYQLNAAPEVAIKESVCGVKPIDPTSKELLFNPKFDNLFAPVVGPENPFKSQQQKAVKNTLAGYVEPAHVNDFHFESQRLTFNSYGYAIDPTADGSMDEGHRMVGSSEGASSSSSLTVFEKTKVRPGDKRKKAKNNDPSDIDGFAGPWAPYKDERRNVKPSEEEQEELDEILAKRNKKGRRTEDKPMEEKTVLHIKDPYDYQGRSFLHVPQDVGGEPARERASRQVLPAQASHPHMVGSLEGPFGNPMVPSVRPPAALLQHGLQSQVVGDIAFDNKGERFLSAGYDRYVKLWDTETGNCIARFTNRKVAYCVKFNPDNDKQNLFVAGTSDKKIVCWDVRTKEIVQEYDRHLGAVNTITFVDDNRRFVSTSDDKSMRVWEWDIPCRHEIHRRPFYALHACGHALA
ncbi:hypothetical protein MTO96_008486 [Rhipicephalus appendiculatus]